MSIVRATQLCSPAKELWLPVAAPRKGLGEEGLVAETVDGVVELRAVRFGERFGVGEIPAKAAEVFRVKAVVD